MKDSILEKLFIDESSQSIEGVEYEYVETRPIDNYEYFVIYKCMGTFIKLEGWKTDFIGKVYTKYAVVKPKKVKVTTFV